MKILWNLSPFEVFSCSLNACIIDLLIAKKSVVANFVVKGNQSSGNGIRSAKWNEIGDGKYCIHLCRKQCSFERIAS